MTNDTIDHDARVTQAAIARLPLHAVVGTDLDAARMRIMRTLGSPPTAVLAKTFFTAMTPDKPSRPLGVAGTTAGLPNQRRDGKGEKAWNDCSATT